MIMLMPADPVMIKTIVTMDMGEQIAAHYGLRTVNVLTGFKFIGEQIGKMRLLKLQKSGFVDFERLRKEPFGDNWRKVYC